MKKLYVSYVTEYELGWGSKPDGIAISKSLSSLKKYIDEMKKDQNYEYYWTYSEPEEMITDSDTKEINSLDKNKVIELSKFPKGKWYKNVVA